MDVRTAGRNRGRALGASAVLVVAALAAGCGSSEAGDAGGGTGALVPADDCAGERDGPVAAVGMDTATGDERWSRPLGEHRNTLEAGGLLVAIDRQGAAIGLDPATGRAVWCRAGGPAVDSTVSLAGTVVVSSGSTVVAFSAPSTIVAFDARTGQDLWSGTTPDSIMTVPQVRGDHVLLVEPVANATYAGQPPDETNPVLATFDLATGAPVDGPAEVLMMESQVNGSLVRQVLGPEPYQVTAIVSDATTGAERWRLTRHGVSVYAVDDLVVFIDQQGGASPADARTTTDELIAYSAADGTQLWSVRMDAASPHVMPGGELVLWASGSEVTAIDRSSGAVRWTADHGSPGVGGPESESGSYSTFVPSSDGTVIAGVIVAQEPYRD